MSGFRADRSGLARRNAPVRQDPMKPVSIRIDQAHQAAKSSDQTHTVRLLDEAHTA
ncbi:MAG: hypothetical protein H7338_06725 [Candidatus Sericytochromatia bacterium]|nr:hypothetical protein [Candidatus Sericytochromatia bacterium]